MWSWEASRGLEPLWSWQDPDRRGKEEKTVKEELKLEVERETEKSKSGPEMMARKDYIPFNRYNFTKSHIWQTIPIALLKPFQPHNPIAAEIREK